MYRMRADGTLFFYQGLNSGAYQALNPRAKFELNKAGSLSFVLSPDNVGYDAMQKMKTVVTLERDGDVLFRGRVLETTTDLFNQKEVYCEGELSYLLDSMSRPVDFDGTAVAFLTHLINSHNVQVEADQRFTLGLTTALKATDRVKLRSYDYVPTLDEIRSTLMGEFRGYLRVRWTDGVRYLDYVDEFDQACSQQVSFGVNLVDMESRANAQDIFTVLIPLGKLVDGAYTTIADVNGGVDCIEDAQGIAKYGRIVRTRRWSDVDDPATLLALGQAHMAQAQEESTIYLTAVDLVTAGVQVDGIHLGDSVQLVSAPHDINRFEVCTGIELNIENPEKSRYTFGLPLNTLTDSYAEVNRRAAAENGHFHRWLKETEDSFDVEVAALNSRISLKADLILLDGYVKATELEARLAQFDFSGIDSLEANRASIENLDVTSLACDGGIANLSFLGVEELTVGSGNATWQEVEVLTWVGLNTTLGSASQVRPLDGSFIGNIDVVTNVSLSRSFTKIRYLGEAEA